MFLSAQVCFHKLVVYYTKLAVYYIGPKLLKSKMYKEMDKWAYK